MDAARVRRPAPALPSLLLAALSCSACYMGHDDVARIPLRVISINTSEICIEAVRGEHAERNGCYPLTEDGADRNLVPKQCAEAKVWYLPPGEPKLKPLTAVKLLPPSECR